jgi:two-component system response regulator RegX3
MKAKVLIIEDVAEMGQLVTMYLEKEGMACTWVESAEAAFERLEALTTASEAPFDLIILDLNLPGMDGFEFLQRFRKTNSVPVLIMSARDADEDIISGLGGGADEFVTKPFSPRVLVARVRALIRRVQEEAAGVSSGNAEESTTFGDFTLYYKSCMLKKGDERIPLSAKEFEVLSFLSHNPGTPLSPERIYSEVWKNAYGDLSAVAVYIQRLRKKIEADSANPKFIETVFGMGYRFMSQG